MQTTLHLSNASEFNIGKIQHTHNETLRIVTCSHKMSSIDHLHSEEKMLQIEDHVNLVYAQYYGTLYGHIERLSPYYHGGPSTTGNEGDTLHQT